MTPSYWERVLEKRIARRRALAVTGAAMLGGAVLAACGGDGKPEGEVTISGERITKPENSTAQAKRGGIYHSYITSQPASEDPLTASRLPEDFERAYSRLIKQKESV